MAKILQQSSRSAKPLWREYGEALLAALIIALIIRTFIVQTFYIPSESMVNTLLVGDRLVGNKFVYGVKIPFTHTFLYRGDGPARGDIIIFEYPEDPSIDFIKRVVGIPGDTIEIRDKQLFRNGEAVKEPYTRFDPNSLNGMNPQLSNYGPVTLPPDKYFAMGDNRDNSKDSRFWGFVDRSAIRAKAWRLYWSRGEEGIRWSRLGKLLQ